MKRREFIARLESTAGWLLLVPAQQRTTPIIGWLDVRPPEPPREGVEGFRRDLGRMPS